MSWLSGRRGVAGIKEGFHAKLSSLSLCCDVVWNMIWVGARVKKIHKPADKSAIPHLTAFLCFLSQSTKPFSFRVAGLADLSSVTDGVISLETGFLPGLPLWQRAPQRPCVSPSVAGTVWFTESDCVDLVVHCPVGKVLSDKYYNMINSTTSRVCVRASVPGLGLQKHRSSTAVNRSLAGELNGSKQEASETGQRHTVCLLQVPAEMS